MQNHQYIKTLSTEEVEKYAKEHPDEIVKLKGIQYEENKTIEINGITYCNCVRCGEWSPIDDLVDTETFPYGGYGYAHIECYEDGC